MCSLLLLSVVEVSSLNSQFLVDTFENCSFKKKRLFMFLLSIFVVEKKGRGQLQKKLVSLLVLPLLFF